MHGSRYLVNKTRVFEFNAWDDVEWDDKQEAEALKKVQLNSVIKFSEDEINKYEDDANKFWNSFYDIHANKFFKDRHWLFTEFPELALNHTGERKTIFEIGCGVGNTVFPILQCTKNEDVFIYCCDFSEKAITILQEAKEYDPTACNAFVLDVTKEEWAVPFLKNSVDIIVLIFVLSAINPERFTHVLKQIYEYLKPGGTILFRDYGKYDLAQLRFKEGHCIGENFYVRGDGTRVYFFTQDEVDTLFKSVGFEQVQNRIDRRLQVNRGKLLKMYRVWIQAKYRKPMT
ncbi:Methyltransferase domain [Popillia japonica]|uniref:tRNA N(3)-methylcytidine methyltransferase n=1 Tax=Popillia japonica TaxID=7064 RepID=A0AAW1MHY8_POPJA